MVLLRELAAHPDIKAHGRACCDLQVDAEAKRAAARQLREQAVLQAVAAGPARTSDQCDVAVRFMLVAVEKSTLMRRSKDLTEATRRTRCTNKACTGKAVN